MREFVRSRVAMFHAAMLLSYRVRVLTISETVYATLHMRWHEYIFVGGAVKGLLVDCGIETPTYFGLP